MFTAHLSAGLLPDGTSGSSILVVLGVGLLVAFLVASKLVQVVVGILESFVQLAMTMGAVALVVGGVGAFAGLLALLNATRGTGS